MNDGTKINAKRIKLNESYKQYLFLIPILEKQTLSYKELGDCLEAHGFHRTGTDAVVATLTNHCLIYNPTPTTYRILTKESLETYEKNELERRRLKKRLIKGEIK